MLPQQRSEHKSKIKSRGNLSSCQGSIKLEMSAEARMSGIEERILALESTGNNSSSNAAVQEAVRAYQIQVLEKLKAIRQSLASEGGDVKTIKAERDAALAENAALKKEVDRLNYRVRHLVKALNEEESKHASK